LPIGILEGWIFLKSSLELVSIFTEAIG